MRLKYPLILGSQSPRRSKILEMLDIPFQIQSAQIDESLISSSVSPEGVPEYLASRKATSISQSNPHSLVLGYDTLVYFEGNPMGKPANAKEALEMLKILNGKTHFVISGICLSLEGTILNSSSEKTAVSFIESSTETLREYANSPEPLDKAGSYAIQGKGAQFIDKIAGCYYNVVGLPIQKTIQFLKPYIY